MLSNAKPSWTARTAYAKATFPSYRRGSASGNPQPVRLKIQHDLPPKCSYPMKDPDEIQVRWSTFCSSFPFLILPFYSVCNCRVKISWCWGSRDSCIWLLPRSCARILSLRSRLNLFSSKNHTMKHTMEPPQVTPQVITTHRWSQMMWRSNEYVD